MQNTRPVATYRMNRLPVVTRCDAPPNRSTLAKDATMGTTNMAKTCLESRLRGAHAQVNVMQTESMMDKKARLSERKTQGREHG